MGIRNLLDSDGTTIAAYATFAVILFAPLALPFFLGWPDPWWLGVIVFFIYARFVLAVWRGLVHPGTWHGDGEG